MAGSGRYGTVSRVLHWTGAALVLALIPLGAWIARMEPSLDGLWLFGLHKSLGASVAALTLLRIGWRLLRPPPPLAPGPMARLARATHAGLLMALVLMPLLGWIGSSATGIDTMLFDRWVLPPIVAPSERIEGLAFGAHAVMGWTLAILIGLHVAGALHGQFIRRDGTLTRMIGR